MDTMGAGIGIVSGGWQIEVISWRSIFLLPAPFMTLIWLLSFWVVVDPPAQTRQAEDPSLSTYSRFDWLGSAIFSAFSFLLLLVLNRGNDFGWKSNLVAG